MGWFLFPYFILCFFHLLLFNFTSYSASWVPLCNYDETSALLQFKNSLALSNASYFSQFCVNYQSSYPKTASWENGTNCCLWDGVTCDSKSGHVIGLDLSCSWLQGKLHRNSTLFQLAHLQTLNLAFNEFFESPIFSGFGDLVDLTHLNLSYSGFSGVISSKISHLSNLVSLDLSNSFSDETLRFDPSTWKKLIFNATNLREISLSRVNMSSIKPSSLSLLMNLSSSLVSLDLGDTLLQGNVSNNILCLPNLQKLDLSENENLTGQLPKSNWSTHLRYLDLSFSAFSGQFLDSIGHLKSLNYLGLSGLNIDGPIPLPLLNLSQLTSLLLTSSNISGEIPSSFSNLQHLSYLDLSNNNLSGMTLDVLGNLSKLEDLTLRGNNISGEIPSSFSNLQHLQALDLSNNNLSSMIPDVFGNLSKLEYLYLSHNNLEGQLPSSLFDLTQLSHLDCSSNKLVGQIPDKISRLSNLRYLSLFDNKLNGIIPQGCLSLPSLFSLHLSNNQLTGLIGEFSTYSLRYCFLSNNKLQGNIPKSMFNLVNISSLDLSSNTLSGFVNFHQFSKLQFLHRLDLSHNNLSIRFDSNIDYSIPSLQYLILSSCNITSVPKFFRHLQYLEYLDLSKNKIHGRISKWWNKHLTLSLRNIFYIDLSFNMLQGDIPPTICNASPLAILNLSHNNLTGLIPQCLGILQSLLVLDLQMNNFHGIIPRNFSKRNALETLKLNGNWLEGPLPQSLAHCKYLEVLDLGDNNIEDTFPNWLEPLQELQVLILRANKFHGVITRLNAKHTFRKLRIFDVSNNSFSGPLPTAYIKEFKGMMNVNAHPIGLHYMESKLSSYNDSVVVTMKGNFVVLERILTTLAMIDLSNNKFEGEIPEAIGKLNSLIGLNLSHNTITGNIPQALGDLQSLEWLDLSSNKLKGEIPVALTDLNFLSFLNLSQNQLEGMIPTGRQFNTFENNSYEGNMGLCGFPLSKSCNNDEKQPPDSKPFDHDEKLEFGWKPVAMGYACGMVFGMLVGYIVFSVRKLQWLVRLVGGVSNLRVKKRSNRAH